MHRVAERKEKGSYLRALSEDHRTFRKVQVRANGVEATKRRVKEGPTHFERIHQAKVSPCQRHIAQSIILML